MPLFMQRTENQHSNSRSYVPIWDMESAILCVYPMSGPCTMLLDLCVGPLLDHWQTIDATKKKKNKNGRIKTEYIRIYLRIVLALYRLGF